MHTKIQMSAIFITFAEVLYVRELISRVIAICVTAASFLACSKTEHIYFRQSSTRVGICIGTDTRTTIDAASGTFSWDADDQIAVWARHADGSWEFSGKAFDLVAGNGSKAYFGASLFSPMQEDSYTYYISYPVPENTSGTEATFRVPAVQDGLAGDGAGIMIGGPVEYGPLEPLDEGRPINEEKGFGARMRHLLHFLRFYLPEGTDVLGEPVERIDISMPQDIAGTVSVDLESGNASLTDGSSGISLELEDPLEAGDGGFATAAIFPPARAYEAGEQMTVNMYTASKWAVVAPISLRGRTFEAGHITSVPLLPSEVRDFFSVIFALASNNLGENVQKVTLTLPEGTVWPGTDSNVYTYAGGLPTGASFRISSDSEQQFRALGGKSVSVRYESENAIVSQSLTLGDFSTGTNRNQNLDCPYLFAEDFSGAGTSLNQKGNLSASGHSTDTIEGSAYGLPGWTGNQIAVIEAGGNKVLAIRHQNEYILLQGTYRGRCDSAPLSGIKPGHNVKVKVDFDYTGYAKGKNSPQITYGWTTNANALAGYYQGGSAAIKGGTLIENQAASLVTAPLDGSADDVDIAASFEIDRATSAHRLSWDCMGSKTAMGTTQEWIFIDNIKVKIAE